MVIFTAKLSKPKLIGLVVLAAALILLIVFLANRGTGTALEAAAPGKLETPESRQEFLSSLGYTVGEPLRTQEVLIPKEWNEVYAQYAALQSSQGFKLEKYKGKKVMQYVYEIENWPQETSDPVYATLLTYKGKLIAGEISRGGADGFLRPLLSA